MFSTSLIETLKPTARQHLEQIVGRYLHDNGVPFDHASNAVCTYRLIQLLASDPAPITSDNRSVPIAVEVSPQQANILFGTPDRVYDGDALHPSRAPGVQMYANPYGPGARYE